MAEGIRDAATVILARPTGRDAYEILLTKRPESMRFMGGSYVFPGGALDPDDCAPELQALSALAPQQARARIGEHIDPHVALGLHWCAVRELFEEVGVLLARHTSGAPVDPEVVRERYAPRQHELAHDGGSFAEFLRSEGLVAAVDLLAWHGRLITPESSPIRFDARFFVAPMPDGQQLHLDPREVPEAVWMTPAAAAAAASDKRVLISMPTISVIQGLGEVPGYDQVLKGSRPATEIKTTELSELVFCVLAPNPGMMTGPGTNTFIVGRGDTVVIDPAVPDPLYLDAVVEAATSRGTPAMILLTHMHPDHIGGAAALAERLRVGVAAWHEAAESTSYVTHPLRDDDAVRAGDITLRALHTPGHASHHLCFLLEEEGSLFAGDVVAGVGTVVISPPDGNMADYMSTLRRLTQLPIGRIYPAHGPVQDDGHGKLAEYLHHRLEREAQVVAAMRAGAATPKEMVKHIYTDISVALHPMAERSVLAHLEVLEREGRARRSDDRWALVD